MSSESDPTHRRVPSLVSYCQRVLSAHADAITCLGDDVRYDVIKPVLECCTADTLLRLEQSSPHLEQETADLWERLCFQSYPLLARQYARDDGTHPESWRDQYFLLRGAEAHRLEEVASRLRNQRMEEAERKKEREVKLTDKLPPTKRTRSTWGVSSQPKTLFQKTRLEATKLRRPLYTPRLAPQIPHTNTHLPAISSTPSVSPPKSASDRITVRPLAASLSLASTPPKPPAKHRSTQSMVLVSPKRPPSPPSQIPLPAHTLSQVTEARPPKPPLQKKDPMASLFMPKHRSLSQRPSHAGNNNRSVPAR